MSKMTCNEVLEQLWEYLDEDARAELKKSIDEHLGGCKDCKVQVDSLRKTVLLYNCEEKVTVPIALSDKLRDALGRAYGEKAS